MRYVFFDGFIKYTLQRNAYLLSEVGLKEDKLMQPSNKPVLRCSVCGELIYVSEYKFIPIGEKYICPYCEHGIRGNIYDGKAAKCFIW